MEITSFQEIDEIYNVLASGAWHEDKNELYQDFQQYDLLHDLVTAIMADRKNPAYKTLVYLIESVVEDIWYYADKPFEIKD